MLHLILTILKVILTLLLVILGVVFLLILTILLVPIRYQAEAEYYGDIRVKAKVGWLLNFIGGTFVLNKPKGEALSTDLDVHIAFIHPLKIMAKMKDKKKSKEERSEETFFKPVSEATEAETISEALPQIGMNSEDLTDQTDTVIQEEAVTQAEPVVSEEAVAEPERPLDPQPLPDDNEVLEEDTDHPEKKKKEKKTRQARKPKGDPFKKIKDLIGKLQNLSELPDVIGEKLESLSEKLEKLSKKKDHLFAIFENEKNSAWIFSTLTDLKRIIFALFPAIKRLHLHYGTGDPALTGQILGGLSVIYAVCGDVINVEAEFDQTMFEGDICLKGKIVLFPFLIFAIRHFLNRRFFHIIKQIKRI